jgi:hypothetical protein
MKKMKKKKEQYKNDNQNWKPNKIKSNSKVHNKKIMKKIKK